MTMIEKAVAAPVLPIEKIGFNGDFLEAELMAYLAARAYFNLPLSFPTTTGVPKPITGGKMHKVRKVMASKHNHYIDK